MSQSQKDAIRRGNTGKPRTPEWRAALSAARKENLKNPEIVAKIYAAIPKGEKAHNWKGGVTSINMVIRKSREYKEWRTAVFSRDNFTCVFCGVRGGRLNADHIKPFATHPELRFELSNGRTLCEPCHRKTDTYGKRYTGKLTPKES